MGEWLEQYESLNLGGTKELPWIDLKVSLEMLLQQAVGCTDDWNDADTKINGRRSFPTFPEWLEDSELDWHKYVSKDDEINVSNQLNWLSLQAPSSDDMAHLRPELASNSNWVMANKYYDRSLLLMHLLEEIRSKSSNSFSREQAEQLSSFLNRLIMIQHEHRVVAYDLYDHLKQLRKSDAAPYLHFLPMLLMMMELHKNHNTPCGNKRLNGIIKELWRIIPFVIAWVVLLERNDQILERIPKYEDEINMVIK